MLAPDSLFLIQILTRYTLCHFIKYHLLQMWGSYDFKVFYNQIERSFQNLTVVQKLDLRCVLVWSHERMILGNEYLQHMHLWIRHNTSEVWMDEPTRTARAEQSGLLVCDWNTSDNETHTETWRAGCVCTAPWGWVCLYMKRSARGRRRVGRGAAIPWRSFRLLEMSQSEVSAGRREAQLFTEFAT